MKRFLLSFLGFFVVVGVAYAADQIVNQGTPGNRGPWPVTMGSSTTPDGGTNSGIFVTPQLCVTTAYKATSVGVAAGDTPSTQLAGRRYIRMCSSLQNTGTPLIKCRTDGTDPVMAVTNPGDIFGIGDCIEYPVGSGTVPRCISDAAATSMLSFECSG